MEQESPNESPLVEAIREEGIEVKEGLVQYEEYHEDVVTAVSVKVAPEADVAIAQMVEQGADLLRYAKDRTIEAPSDVKAATEDLSIISSLKKALEAKKKEYAGPLDALKKTVLETFKRITAPVEEADQLTRQKILAYQAEQRRKAEAAAEIARKEQELAQEKAGLNGTPAPEPKAIVVQETPTTMHGELGTASQKANWKWEVTDFAAVPDEYKMINAAVLTPVVKASKGKVPIPGIRQYNDPILGVTTKRGEES